MFPEDPTANLNAADIELQQGSLQRAAQFLGKANPELGETLNNKGVLKLLQGDVDAAEALFKQAKDKGIVEAETNLEEAAKKRKDIQVFDK
jgi:Tfp pilus assembly protein PilF